MRYGRMQCVVTRFFGVLSPVGGVHVFGECPSE
jgi:hypothetical protein